MRISKIFAWMMVVGTFFPGQEALAQNMIQVKGSDSEVN